MANCIMEIFENYHKKWNFTPQTSVVHVNGLGHKLHVSVNPY
jgi:hypothetical protein